MSVIVPSVAAQPSDDADAAKPLRIAFAGTATRSKALLLGCTDQALRDRGYTVAQSATGHATQAADLGFPIRDRQTVETTEWLLGSTICADAEATLGVPDILLVRDSCLDPLAHLSTVAQAGACRITRSRWQQVVETTGAYAAGYDLVLVVSPEVPGNNIDDHDAAVDVELLGFVEANRLPYAEVDDGPDSVQLAVQFVTAQRPLCHPDTGNASCHLGIFGPVAATASVLS